MNIKWRERFIAAAIHFLATALVAGIAAALIFFVWFPGPMADMVGGSKLFMMVVACDTILGPLLSLVIYNSAKPRRELIIDYSVVAFVQLAALVYGVSVVAASRPVFVGFYHDRLEIVASIQLEDDDLRAGIAPQFQTRSWLGPRLMSVEPPTDLAEKNKLLFESIGGKDGHLNPKFYREYDAARTSILVHARPIDALLNGSGDAGAKIESAVAATGKSKDELRWLLLHHRFGFATALIDARTGRPVRYLNIDPDWVDKRKPQP